MTKSQTSMFNEEGVMEWMEEHRMELRQSVSGPRILYESLVLGFVVGLVVHVIGYFLASSGPSGFLGLLADLLLALGWSLWTGVVVSVFVQVVPEAKRRQIKQALDAYEALRRENAQADAPREESSSKRTSTKRSQREPSQKRTGARKGK